MLTLMNGWYRRYLSNPEAVVLFLILVLAFSAILLIGHIIAPVLASLVVSYLLLWFVTRLVNRGIKRPIAVMLVYIGFLSFFTATVLFLFPLLWKQLSHLFEELPNMVMRLQSYLYLLPEKFPDYISKELIDGMTQEVLIDLKTLGRSVLSASLTSIPILLTVLVYTVLVPLMVFFFLKDTDTLTQWLRNLLPKQRHTLQKVWREVDSEIGNYIRGKVAEILIVGSVTFLAFMVLKLKYAALLAALVGLSVLVPYIGAAAVTLPVLLMAFIQFGISNEFWWVFFVYGIIQGIDGNILVPILFSEAVSLHPIAIIVAILVFGGLWGFWGAFFAIPLATLVKSVLHSWPICTKQRD